MIRICFSFNRSAVLSQQHDFGHVDCILVQDPRKPWIFWTVACWSRIALHEQSSISRMDSHVAQQSSGQWIVSTGLVSMCCFKMFSDIRMLSWLSRKQMVQNFGGRIWSLWVEISAHLHWVDGSWEDLKCRNAITPLQHLQFDANYVLRLQDEDTKSHKTIIMQNHTKITEHHTKITDKHTQSHKSIPLWISPTIWVNSCWLRLAKTYEICSRLEWSCRTFVKDAQEKQCVNKMDSWRSRDVDLVGIVFFGKSFCSKIILIQKTFSRSRTWGFIKKNLLSITSSGEIGFWAPWYRGIKNAGLRKRAQGRAQDIPYQSILPYHHGIWRIFIECGKKNHARKSAHERARAKRKGSYPTKKQQEFSTFYVPGFMHLVVQGKNQKTFCTTTEFGAWGVN